MNKDYWLKTIAARQAVFPEYGYPVNRKYCIQLKDYPVLRKMLKKGLITRVRIGFPKTKRTYLRIGRVA